MGSCGSAVLGAVHPEEVKTPAEKEERDLQREKQRGEDSGLPCFLQASWLLVLVPQETGLPPPLA